jgi:hypothetical protein
MKKLTTLLFIFVFAGSMAFAQNNKAEIDQLSDQNKAEITQDGKKNSGYIKQSSYAEHNDHNQVQDGENNEATASVYADNIEGTQVQWGKNNVSALNQAASNSSAETYQGGLDQTARVHQAGGSGNSATVYQALAGNGEAETLEGEFFLFGEDNSVGIKQDGSHNEVTTAQFGVGNSAGFDWWGNTGIHQKGSGNDAMLGQFGYGNSASITQQGNHNQTTIMQNGGSTGMVE